MILTLTSKYIEPEVKRRVQRPTEREQRKQESSSIVRCHFQAEENEVEWWHEVMHAALHDGLQLPRIAQCIGDDVVAIEDTLRFARCLFSDGRTEADGLRRRIDRPPRSLCFA